MEVKGASRKKAALDLGSSWKDPPTYAPPAMKEAQKASFDLAFSNHHF